MHTIRRTPERMPRRANFSRFRRNALALVSLALVFSAKSTAHAAADFPVPEGGSVQNGAYMNEYFGLRYPLPPNWIEDLKGPEPSNTGYYSLVALRPADSFNGSILVAAQDEFFSQQPLHSAADFIAQMKHALDQSLTVSEGPAQRQLAGREFAALEYTGAGLIRLVLATEIRCHVLMFAITSRDSALVRRLADSIGKASFADSARWPGCVSGYASAQNLVHRMDPPLVGPRFSTVPLRIIIDANGDVADAHAIAGPPEETKAAADAVKQWKFKPYQVDGKPAELETGVLFDFAQKSQ